jgi:GNAT superfamily N-acetyltransferase
MVEALEANMAAFWAGYGRAPRAEIYEGEDLLRVVTGVSEPLFNGVFRASLMPDAVDGTIDETLARVASRRVPMFWWVGPCTRPADLGTHLEQHGFAHAGNSPAMAVDLRTLPEEPSRIPGLAMAPVEDLETLRTWARVAAIGTEFPERFHDELVALEVGVGLERHGGRLYTRYVAYQDGEAVGTSALLLHAGVAGIFAVATVPRARGRGIGTVLTLAPLLEARRQGYRVGTLQSSPMGFPVYRRLGFREVCNPIEMYLWSP